jgi:hypothetical protein
LAGLASGTIASIPKIPHAIKISFRICKSSWFFGLVRATFKRHLQDRRGHLPSHAMQRLAIVKPNTVASRAGSQTDGTGHVKCQLRAAALPCSVASPEDRTMRL